MSRYGRIFHVNGCNDSTRNFLRDIKGIEPVANGLPPIDRYETERYIATQTDLLPRYRKYTRCRRDLMSRETGKDPTVSHNIQKNPMKVLFCVAVFSFDK